MIKCIAYIQQHGSSEERHALYEWMVGNVTENASNTQLAQQAYKEIEALQGRSLMAVYNMLAKLRAMTIPKLGEWLDGGV